MSAPSAILPTFAIKTTTTAVRRRSSSFRAAHDRPVCSTRPGWRAWGVVNTCHVTGIQGFQAYMSRLGWHAQGVVNSCRIIDSQGFEAYTVDMYAVLDKTWVARVGSGQFKPHHRQSTFLGLENNPMFDKTWVACRRSQWHFGFRAIYYLYSLGFSKLY